MSGKKNLTIPIFVGGFLLILVITAGGIFFVLSTKNQTTVTNATNTTKLNSTEPTALESVVSNPVSSPTNTTALTPVADIAAVYKDGTYTVDQSYLNPDGTSNVKIALTLSSGLISKVVVTPETGGESARYQQRFASGISSFVVGKNLDNAALRVNVSGASLTTEAFNVALQKIKTQALV